MMWAQRVLLLLLPAAAMIADVPAAGTPSMEQEVALLKAQVAISLATEQRLAATNTELKHEVDGWVDVGTKVLKREAHIVDAIKQAGDGASGDEAALRAAVINGLTAPEPERKTPLTLATRSAARMETKSTEPLPSQIISWHLLVLILTVLATVAFCWKGAPAQFAGILSREKHLQLSELQLEGANMGFGEGYLLMEPSGGLRTRTRAAEQKEGSTVLRFDEVLPLSVQKGDGPCIITIFRRGEHRDTRIGSVSLEAAQLLSCVGRGPEAPGQYLRFNVQAEANSSQRELRVAMRIRDLASVPGAQITKAGLGARKSMAHVV